MQAHHAADNNQRGCMDFAAFNLIRQAIQGAGDHFLKIGGASGDQPYWRVPGATVFHQLAADLSQTDQPHVKHHGFGFTDQVRPVQIHRAIFAVASNETAQPLAAVMPGTT